MFLKHIGKNGDRKVAIVFREVPGEEHMALVLYPETLPRHIHDSVMKVIESPEGQTSETLGDAMFRSLLADGRPMLETLHKEGMIKKVQTAQIVVTPNAKSHVRLDELNKVINELRTGEKAKERMEELDINSGLVDSTSKRRESRAVTEMPFVAPADGVLDDAAIATNLLKQADQIRNQVTGLLAEADRLTKEAAALMPNAAPEVPKSKRGRKSAKVAVE